MNNEAYTQWWVPEEFADTPAVQALREESSDICRTGTGILWIEATECDAWARSRLLREAQVPYKLQCCVDGDQDFTEVFDGQAYVSAPCNDAGDTTLVLNLGPDGEMLLGGVAKALEYLAAEDKLFMKYSRANTCTTK